LITHLIVIIPSPEMAILHITDLTSHFTVILHAYFKAACRKI